MKIAMDLTCFTEKFGGGKEQVVCNLIKGISETSPATKLRLFCYEGMIDKVRKLAPDSEIIAFRRRNIKKFIQDMYIRTFRIKKHLGDSDILFFPIYYTGFARFCIPTVVLPHDIQFKSRPHHFNIVTRIKESVLYRMDFRLRDKIIAISDFDCQEMQKHYPGYSGKLKKIYNPIVAGEIDGPSKRSHILAINVGFDHKNILTLIKAYKRIEGKTDKPLYLVGRSYDNLRLDEHIKKLGMTGKIKYLGYVPDKELSGLLHDSYAYITTSTYEGFGMTAVEAVLNRVPVISSMQPALVEVTDGKALYYEPYEDDAALAEKILELADNYPDDIILENLRNEAAARFHYRKIAGDYLDFFKGLANHIIYSDPMSYHNLALYDYNLLSNMKDENITYAGNYLYNLTDDLGIRRLYKYSDHKNAATKFISYLLSQLRLCSIARCEKARVLHLQWSRMALLDYLLIRRLKKKHGVRFVYTSHDTFSHNMEASYKKAYMRLMGIADVIIVHTEKAAATLRSDGFHGISVINHGLLDISKMYPAEAVDFEKDGRILFSLLGYMEEYKGTDLLLKAWLSSPKLLAQEKIHLAVIGRNKMDYEPMVPEDANVTYYDLLLSDGEFTRWMELTDVVVLPYQSISQSGLMMTAFSMNKRFIVNDVGELAAPVRKYDLGWVINENDYDGLRIQLEKIVDEILSRGNANVSDDVKHKIDEDYSWAEAGRRTAGIYRELMGEKR